ncbi:DUF2147 domain-containing protein [Brumimicrobium oceani]|nr:DUF2147 domain-containing protein [Brumimicrobium oceani]
MIKYLLILCLAMMSLNGNSQSIEGVWQTYDDETGELKSDVKIYKKDGKLYGKVVQLHVVDDLEVEATCRYCTDYRKDKPILGMLVMTALVKDGKEWEGDGTLLDPENGKTYDGEVWLVDDNKLAVRGYIGWFFRTQYWIRK